MISAAWQMTMILVILSDDYLSFSKFPELKEQVKKMLKFERLMATASEERPMSRPIRSRDRKLDAFEVGKLKQIFSSSAKLLVITNELLPVCNDAHPSIYFGFQQLVLNLLFKLWTYMPSTIMDRIMNEYSLPTDTLFSIHVRLFNV